MENFSILSMNSIFIQVPRTNKMSFLPYLSLYGPCLCCHQSRPTVRILLLSYEHAIKLTRRKTSLILFSPYRRSTLHGRLTWRGCCERTTKEPPWIDQISYKREVRSRLSEPDTGHSGGITSRWNTYYAPLLDSRGSLCIPMFGRILTFPNTCYILIVFHYV